MARDLGRLSWLPSVLALATGCFLCSCSEDAAPVGSPGEPVGECNSVETSFENGSAKHVPACSELSYSMSPPVFGDHYPSWAAYGSYDFPLPLGFLVHNLEHGAVVVFYNCPEGCEDEVAEAQASIEALPVDPRGSPQVKRQVVLVPDPSLSARWGAAAWGHSLTGDCFDAGLFAAFYAAHVGRGPEDLCAEGVLFAENPCP
jgi:hypothetical protein